jgi:hypothetical protein
VGDGGHCSVEEVPQSAQPRGYRDGRGGAQSGGRSSAHPQTSQFHLVFSEMGAGGELHKVVIVAQQARWSFANF